MKTTFLLNDTEFSIYRSAVGFLVAVCDSLGIRVEAETLDELRDNIIDAFSATLDDALLEIDSDSSELVFDEDI